MTLVIPPGFGLAAITFTGAVGTQPYVTTIGVDLSDAGGDFVDAANGVMEAYGDTLLQITSNNLTLDRVTLSVGQDGPGGSVDSNLPPKPGVVSGALFPPTAMSAILRKSTNILGRPGRGRMFIPGVLLEADVDQDGTIVVGKRGTVNQRAAEFMAALNSQDVYPSLPPVLLHSEGGPAPTPINSLVISDVVGWIRGRIR